jgi:hypothetical protein
MGDSHNPASVNPRRSQAQAAEDARAARTRYDNDPPPKKRRRMTKFVARNDGSWYWLCVCGVDSWVPYMTRTDAEGDHAAHLHTSPMHQNTGWFNRR